MRITELKKEVKQAITKNETIKIGATMKTRLTFLPFADAEEFAETTGFIQLDFDTKQKAFDYMCFYATMIDIATIQIHGQAIVDSYNCETGFLRELVKKQNKN